MRASSYLKRVFYAFALWMPAVCCSGVLGVGVVFCWSWSALHLWLVRLLLSVYCYRGVLAVLTAVLTLWGDVGCLCGVL